MIPQMKRWYIQTRFFFLYGMKKIRSQFTITQLLLSVIIQSSSSSNTMLFLVEDWLAGCFSSPALHFPLESAFSFPFIVLLVLPLVGTLALPVSKSVGIVVELEAPGPSGTSDPLGCQECQRGWRAPQAICWLKSMCDMGAVSCSGAWSGRCANCLNHSWHCPGYPNCSLAKSHVSEWGFEDNHFTYSLRNTSTSM